MTSILRIELAAQNGDRPKMTPLEAKSLGFDAVLFDGALNDGHPPAASGDDRINRLRDYITEWSNGGLTVLTTVDGAEARLQENICEAIKWGASGFVLSAPHRAPPTVLRAAFSFQSNGRPIKLIADVLGASESAVRALEETPIDCLYNSAAWWDFRAPWLIDEISTRRPRFSSISFPIPFDQKPSRWGSDLQQRVILAAFISSGFLMSEDCALLCRDANHSGADAAWLTKLNTLRKTWAPQNADGRILPASGGNDICVLVRFSHGHPFDSDTALVLAFNRSNQTKMLDVGRVLAAAGGLHTRLNDVSLNGSLRAVTSGPLALDPRGSRVFVASRKNRRPRRAPKPADSLRRIELLAEKRIAIEGISPEVDGGRFPAKRIVGDVLEVSADIFSDGHDLLRAIVRVRHDSDREWQTLKMIANGNDRWVARVPLTKVGRYIFTLEASRDLYGSWCEEVLKKQAAGQDIGLELQEGKQLLERFALTSAKARAAFEDLADRSAEGELFRALTSRELRDAVSEQIEPISLTTLGRNLHVDVHRTAARFSAWYELFPRSQSGDPRRHGTFEDVIARLPAVRDLGFDVLYLPPIHPIGKTHRKGRDNDLRAGENDPGSPYAIGGEEGGHKAIHPELGTLEEFRRLVAAAHTYGIEIALDFAIQCSPDHPWIGEHPEWFDWRPDGSIKYAENPPKKYEDIVNVHFYRQAIPSLWFELRDTLLFWIEQGVKIFRVDNPHTKPFPFWEWLIDEIGQQHPDVIFLAEAFTRPKVMRRLAKIGFQQSYTYFTWRNTKRELTEYLTELIEPASSDVYRPNFFVNTPDINPYYLQRSGRPGFIVRATLAATLSPAYGIYSGFELCEARAVPGKEEYAASEKYEIKAWDWDRPGNIRHFLAALNRIRRDNPCLWELINLRFFNAWNDQILLYGKLTAKRDNAILVAVNLDPHSTQSCQFEVPLWEFGLPDSGALAYEDLLTDIKGVWSGKIQTMTLAPQVNPVAIWRITPASQP